ncbi:TetR/AcrR family transcriptional regulator [Paenibacillus alkaliterrae]|uniref:TetR/AcrR family transcriptional regulator n=1 Tax=Paenibacillus alkaliterrae TaxID=320909 RepID=UPI001F2DB55F|nr:TetR/AcrR family transcriptional regulator [Paenibacillus alkaliterrae]MCF2937089.1 TetR/AcrR family transcriptional regulator [Paenibacillus alkaliterrae]
MTTPEGSRTKQELSKEILRTANDLFTEHGVESVSMHQIAKSVGIGQGTLYRRYSNKGDLCMDMMKENFEIFINEIDEYLLKEAQKPVHERLSGVMRRIIAFLDRESKWLGVMQSYNRAEDHKNDFFQSPPYLYLHSVLSRLFREAAEKKLVHSIDPNYAAHSFISVQSPHTYRQLRQVMGYTCEEIQDRFCSMFIDPLFR